VLKRILGPIYYWGAKKISKEILPFINEEDKVLDLGCGSGFLGKEIEKLSKAKVIGLDVNNFLQVNLPFVLFDGKKIPFLDNAFDVVLIAFVLHHTSDPLSLLGEARRVGKKIIIFEDLIEGKISYFRCKLHLFLWRFFYGQKMEKFNFFSEREWEKIFEELRLKVIFKNELNFAKIDPVKKKFFVLERS
jgi:ubiquinone/menaquinone biosynthesis C-methylase UbiE